MADEGKGQQLADLIVAYVEEGSTNPQVRQSVLNYLRTKERAEAFLTFMNWLKPESLKDRLPIV